MVTSTIHFVFLAFAFSGVLFVFIEEVRDYFLFMNFCLTRTEWTVSSIFNACSLVLLLSVFCFLEFSGAAAKSGSSSAGVSILVAFDLMHEFSWLQDYSHQDLVPRSAPPLAN